MPERDGSRPEQDGPVPARHHRSGEPNAGRRGPARGTVPVGRRLHALRRSQQRLTADSTQVEAGAAEPPAVASSVPSRRPGLHRLWASLVNPGRGQIIAALILFVVGVGGVMQIRINTADDTYTNARREDLVQLLDGLSSESRRLESEVAELERTRSELQSGADTQQVARQEAQTRAQELGILAGTLPAEGPGIRLRVADPNNKVDADVLLNAVEEMRDAGAEVIEVNDRVRVVGSTWFGTDASGLVVDGIPVSRPITFEVIGDPHSLEEAARFRGGIVSEITGPGIGGQVQIDQESRVVVDSLHATRDNQYAQPAPPTPR
jgi:uncharacterized protein YlxW (UPF0749 family)